ncbi:PREDICTED: chromatin structure-remodeling complex protein SYD-like [Lupinus angustifolius]|uniref:chromatin structure-remodeling complex protein SYD-like n=1 Tax=Lupinus angustifolius TaxID=3871 RepID=UPI00092FCB3F|nr:PREDICTED: chromatin structure-remodeling complex protein SYD-like [Lupinus angustifolius]
MLDRLLPKLKATDHRVLFFSTMTRLLDVMEEYLTLKQYRYLRLDGHTSGSDRGALIDLFNQSDSPYFIFLLSIRAGGVGVNLQAADTVILFDTDWNPQVDLQAQARAHRIGQKRDVLVLRFETVETVEEQVRASAEHKLGVANQSITAGFFDNNTSAEDRREYLESLLRECKKEEAAPVLDDDALNDILARRYPIFFMLSPSIYSWLGTCSYFVMSNWVACISFSTFIYSLTIFFRMVTWSDYLELMEIWERCVHDLFYLRLNSFYPVSHCCFNSQIVMLHSMKKEGMNEIPYVKRFSLIELQVSGRICDP